MLRSAVRSTIATLSGLAAASPIEIITATFIVVTLTYFQLLHAIKGSDFFNVPQLAPAPARPVHLVRLTNPPDAAEHHYSAGQQHHQQQQQQHILPSSGSAAASMASSATAAAVQDLSRQSQWAPLPISEFRRVLEENAMGAGYVFPASAGGNAAGDKAEVVFVKQIHVVNDEADGLSTDAWEHWLLNDAAVEVDGQRYTYKDLCYDCQHLPRAVAHPLHPAQSTITLFLRPPTPDSPTLAYVNYLARLPAFAAAESNTTFRVLPTGAGGATWGILPSFDGAGLFSALGDNHTSSSEKEEADLLSGLRNVRWFAYAVRALVMRFYALAKVRVFESSHDTGGGRDSR